jgi:hypothetical protein
MRCDLGVLAQAAGFNTTRSSDPAEIAGALRERGGKRFIHVAKPGNRQVRTIPLGEIEIKERFMEAYRRR